MRISVVESAPVEGRPGPKAQERSVDPALVASWADGVLYVHILYDGPVRPGARYVAAHRLLGRTVVLVDTVEEVSPGYGWRARADRPGATLVVALPLRPPPEATVELTVDLTVRGVARLARPFLSWSFRRSARRAVRRLAGRLETRASPKSAVR